MPEKIAYYFFEYDRPPSSKTGKPVKPGRTGWRMTIAEAKERYGDAYRPILATVEYREEWDGKSQSISCGLDENKQLRSEPG